ncbi:NlpC/P60 family protein [Lactococcus cremoris]|uniref:NlpC/P60 family protein n=1 Tax=Lactococcus lactis subsp. cremoris TaxID=1359 RepID=UPI0039F24F0A
MREDEQHAAIYLGGSFILHDSTSTDGVSISRLNQVINKKVLGNMTWGQLFEPGHVRHEV